MIRVCKLVPIHLNNPDADSMLTGFMSGVLIADDWLKQMDYPSTSMQGFITSIYELGCLAGMKHSRSP